ncbi:restriction endonuclease subunit S [Bacteroides caccae]|uniref:Restriction endonuclease subunit S n=2 Tax=Bacteroides caccae TaxID=47678 RepID=A0A412G1E3_9BACE|nr:restriction endonuclease subunit S [Bacteroides caccae]RGR74289.1 restriction endonuclease subunit S [Bacteroides caccae]
MDTKKLRQKILNLAIHGKLVPQDPNDEPASVLLERIKAEKERLIKEGKIKRSKKPVKTSDTPHYQQDVPFEVPEGWAWTTIEEICSKIGSGSTPRGSNYSANGIPFFRSQNVYNDRLVYDDIKYISEEVHQKMKGTEVLANDLLLNITGGSLGRCVVVPADFNCGNVSQHVCIMRSVLVEPEYFHALVLSSYFAKSMKITGSGREGLPKYNLEQMGFPLPPLTEQQRIVAEIKHWFALIDQIEQGKSDLQTIIKQTKSKILDLAIHGKVVPQDPNDEPAIELLKRINPDFTPCDNGHSEKLPQNWTWVKGKNIFAPMKSTKPKNEEFQYIDIDSIDNRRQIISEIKTIKTENAPSRASRYTQKNDVIFSMVRPYLRNIAKVANDNCIASTGFYVCSPIPQLLNSDYCYYLMISDNVVNGLNQFMKGDNSPSINKGHIDEWLFPLPPLAEQQRIVQKIEELFSALDNIQTALEV